MTTREKELLLEKGFAPDQIDEIEEGMLAGVDTTVYARKEYFAIQMRQIRFGLMSGVPVEKYASPDYDWFQMEEIRMGLEDGLDVSAYAFTNVPYDTMRQIRKGLLKGIDLSKYHQLNAGILREFRKALLSKVDIRKYIREGYETEQLKEIRLALEKGENIDPYLRKEFRGASIAEICEGLERGLDVACYAKLEYGWQQMREIRLGLENRVDTGLYANSYYSWQQMREIRLGLENGIDVSSYSSLMHTFSEMKKKRLLLQKEILHPAALEELIHPIEKAEKSFNVVISVSENEMEAYIEIKDASKKVNREEIEEALEERGIRKGIQQNVIEDLVKGICPKRPLLIARGIEPIDGEDGWYEYFFKTEEERAPKLLADGSVDYQNTEWFEMVEHGQKIAYYHEAGEGRFGYTVSGRVLPAKKGKEKSLLAGRGFLLLPDKKTYLATESGKIDLRGSRLEITKMMILDEMTIATGKVDFDGSVYIRGNVGSGTLIKATEDIIVDGFVESANIESGGSVILRQGVNASGNGFIKAGKNVVGKFFEAVKVYAAENIQANYCMNSNLYAEGKLIISGMVGTLVGGVAYAVKGFQAYNVGNQVGLPTYLKLGVNETILKERYEIEGKIKDVNKELTILRNAYHDFRTKYLPEVRNTMEIYLKIESAIFQKEKEFDELQFANMEIENKMHKIEEVRAVVRGNIFDGVFMEVNGIRWNARRVQNVTIKSVNGRIAAYVN